jgi:predicted metalloprotease with PDZ domain
VAEGITDYYASLTLRRAGLISEKEFLALEAREIQALQNTPGRMVMSAEESSFDTWIKYYRQDENSINSQVDYYNKGSILGLLLDLEIRKRSTGTKSLDDVMRYLYNEFFKKDRNYTPEDFKKACELMAGFVNGREELDYGAALAAAGLRLETTNVPGVATSVEKAFLGADLAQEGERLMVRRVYAGSPAYEQGLNTGDQIIAMNNMRANKEFFDARIAEKHPGDLINLTIFRFDDMSTLIIKLGKNVEGPYRIVAVENPTEAQKQILQSWLEATSQ